jgi:hypothetical protein
VETVAIEGTRIVARVHLSGDANATTVAVAAALRLFARYPIFDRFTLTGGGADLDVSRGQAETWLAPDGLGAVGDPAAWPALLARAVEGFRSAA